MFRDRLQTQEEISTLLVNVFSEKQRISYDDYSNINENVTSEMFLSLMTLFQMNLPCSVNYFHYKANFESFLGSTDKPVKTETKTIASPKIVQKFSPVRQFIDTNGINVNPNSQKSLLKYAKKADKKKEKVAESSGSDDDGNDIDTAKFQSKKMMDKLKKQREDELADL